MAKYVKTEEGYKTVNDINGAAGKMDATNPVGTGSFSMNRRADTTTGDCSHAEGYDTEASGDYSHAEGEFTKASSYSSHAEGSSTIASGNCSHAEGAFAKAFGHSSHAEGQNTIASNIASHAEGNETIASGRYQHVQGKFNIDDVDAEGKALNTYAHIVGNGTSNTDRSNAHTLDWNGVGWYQGGLQVGGNAQDDGAKRVLLEGDAIPVPSTASIGQTIIVKAVDENGKPIEWEVANIPEIVQPDYNQNDSTAADYIKNRPFYTGESVENEVCDINAIATASGTAWSAVADGVMGLDGNSGGLLFDGTIEIGKEYTISVNGTKYAYVAEDGAKYGGEDGLVILGDFDAYMNEDIANLKALASFMCGEKIDSAYAGKTFIMMVMAQGNVAPTEFRILDKQQEIVKLDPVYLPDETDPTVPDWAKAETKPAYTATEVGAMPEIETGTVGHFVRVKTVDENGKPTEYESAEIDITIDSELNAESENPVQNKVVNEAISNLNIVINDVSTLANNTAELVGDTAVSEQINNAIAEIPEQVQSDWSINDEDDKAYIKNRPFYTVLSEPIYNDTVTTENFKEEYGYDLNLGNLGEISLVIGDWYVVEFNGAIYKCKCIPDPQLANTDYANNYCYIGNGYRAIINSAEANHTSDMGAVIDILNRAGIEDTGEPFCISTGGFLLDGYELATDEVGTYTIKIYREEITAIEEKYIPENILHKINDFYCSPKVIYKWNEETTYDDFVELPDGAYANLMEKISDDTPSTDFFIGKIFYTRAKSSGKEIQEIERVITSDDIRVLDNMYVVYNYIYIVLEDNSDLGFALTKGIWCMGDYDGSVMNVYELTVSENYRNMIDEVVIPDTIARVSDIPDIDSPKNYVILNSSTEGSTKKFKLTIDDDGVLTATEIVESTV